MRATPSMLPQLRELIRSEEGQDLIEYAMLLAAIALVCVVIIDLLGQGVDSAIDNADTQLRSDGGI